MLKWIIDGNYSCVTMCFPIAYYQQFNGTAHSWDQSKMHYKPILHGITYIRGTHSSNST